MSQAASTPTLAPYRYDHKPNGYFMLPVGDHRHVVIGGPFDAFNGGYGVCLEKHANKAKFADLLLDVPDFGVPTVEALEEAILTIVDFMLHRSDVPVYVGCRGGIGRTGMVLAALVRALGVDEADPVGWVRQHYLSHAVETDAQCKLVMSIDVWPVRTLLSKYDTEKSQSKSWFFQTLRRLSPWQ